MSHLLAAAKVLYRHASKAEGVAMLQKLWQEPTSGVDEFEVFLGLIEVGMLKDPFSTELYLVSVLSGSPETEAFWERRTLSEQATLLDWHGQLAYRIGERERSFESLSRAASLGRDTSLLWRLLGDLCLERGEFDLALRYLKRSLQLHRQLDLDILSGRDNPIGAFSGQDPLQWSHGVEDYMKILLQVTKMAKGRHNLKAARELLMEMIHCFPEEKRLAQLRLMIERSIVESSMALEGPSFGRQRLIERRI